MGGFFSFHIYQLFLIENDIDTALFKVGLHHLAALTVILRQTRGISLKSTCAIQQWFQCCDMCINILVAVMHRRIDVFNGLFFGERHSSIP